MGVLDNDSFQFAIIEATDCKSTKISDVLHGRLACIVVRDFATRKDCEQAFRGFLQSAKTRKREGDATGLYLGAYHWGRERDEFLADSANVARDVLEVSEVESDRLWGKFISQLQVELHGAGHELR